MADIKIVIAEDQPLIRDGLAAILSMDGRYTVAATAGNGAEAIEHVRMHRPQLVLMDIHMPGLNGLEATKRIKGEFPDTKVLILTTFEDEEYMLEAIRFGANGFVVKGVETKVILSTVQDCLDHRISYPLQIQQRLMQAVQEQEQDRHGQSPVGGKMKLTDPTAEEKWAALSYQEQSILIRLKQGKSNQAIAEEMFLSAGTVKNYLHAIYKKLNVSSRSEAIAYLYERGL